MEKYGVTLKLIRKNMNLSQRELSEDIMSQSNYSKIEKGEIEISFFHMVQLVSRLNMSMDEFLWIHNNGNILHTNIDLLMNVGINKSDLSKLKESIREQTVITRYDKEILLVIDSLILVEEGQWIGAQNNVQSIWDRIQRQNTLYYYDLILLNCILYIFPVETAQHMFQMAKERVEKLNYFRTLRSLLNNLHGNIILLLIKEGLFENALQEIESLIPELVKQKAIFKLSLAYIRKGYLLQLTNQEINSIWMDKGFSILRESQLDTPLKIMKEEAEKYLNQAL